MEVYAGVLVNLLRPARVQHKGEDGEQVYCLFSHKLRPRYSGLILV